MIKRILVALDGSGHAAKALDLAADLGSKYGAGLVALHVLSDRPLSEEERRLAEIEYLGDMPAKLDLGDVMDMRGDARVFIQHLANQYGDAALRVRRALADRILDEARRRAAAKGAKAVEAVVEPGDPATTILRVAKESSADLIIMGSRGLGDVAGLLLGSVSHKVAHLAECSCVTVK